MAPSKLSILVTWGRERKKGEDFFVPVNLDLEPYSQEIEILTIVLLIIIKKSFKDYQYCITKSEVICLQNIYRIGYVNNEIRKEGDLRH